VARTLELVRWVLLVSAIAIAGWLAGLAGFVAYGLWARGEPTATTDAIVVLTGGKLRLEAGLTLLAAGRAGKLFISGVNQRVDRDALLHALGPLAKREECCIVIGHEADNTEENAAETASWMRDENYRSLRLVTSWYHVPRSVLEFRRAMPDLRIIAHPVFAHHDASTPWWRHHEAALVVISEYNKYLAALLRALLTPAPIVKTTPSAPLRTTAEGRSG
jgi:uncharacterized SAM-binding protein YcdF (DUF218 family)